MASKNRRSSEEHPVAMAGSSWNQLEYLLHLQMLSSPPSRPTMSRFMSSASYLSTCGAKTFAHWHLPVPIIKDVPHACFHISVSHVLCHGSPFPGAADLRLYPLLLLLKIAPRDMKAMVRQTVCLST